MARNWNWMSWYAVVVLAVGCGTSEKQAAAPAEAKPQAAVTTEAQPRADETAEDKPQAIEVAEPQAKIVDPAVKPAAAAEPVKEEAPRPRTAFFRLDANAPAAMPKVVLSKSHEVLCKVKVGQVLPPIELPRVGANQRIKLADLFGKSATVVVFWKGDRRMTRELLADLGPDVVDLFGDKGVAVVGIAVNESAASAKASLDKAGAKFVNLLDADGKAFAQVGSGRLPRVYLLDPTGKILWLDIEYSQTTRRELHQALHVATGAPPEEPAAKAPAVQPLKAVE